MADAALQQDQLTEDELLLRARRGDRIAIRSIIQQHNQRLYRIARSIVRDDSEAEDVLQEAYCRCFSHLDAFRGDARIGTWLARIVINEALGRRRSAAAALATGNPAEHSIQAQIIPFPQASFHPDPETAAAQRQIHGLLEQAIDALPDAFRTILVARVIEGMSVGETAELFGIPPETVKTRLHRARTALKAALQRQVGPLLPGAFPFGGPRCDRLTETVLRRLGL